MIRTFFRSYWFFPIAIGLLCFLVVVYRPVINGVIVARDLFEHRHEPAKLFELGEYYFGQGAYDIDRAALYYKATLIAAGGLYPGVHYQLGRISFIKGDLRRALIEINQELVAYPAFKRSYYVRGLINAYNKDFLLAEQDFLKFLEWKPESWAGWNDLAFVYFSEGDFNKTAAAAWSGLEYAPDNPWLNNSVGAALLNLGDYARAKYYLDKAKIKADTMTTEDWGKAYPGNNPKVYQEGLSAMKNSIMQNLSKAEARMATTTNTTY